MTIQKDVVESIGNTPLIKLERASAGTGCTILGKAEFMNPGQSVKDRAALAIWRSNFREAWPNLMPSGFDDRFRRLWEYYLAYCEAGFLSGNIDVRQVVFAKPV